MTPTIKPLHFHCGECGHCAGKHSFRLGHVPGFLNQWFDSDNAETPSSGEPVLYCEKCDGECPAAHNPTARVQTLAAMFAQTMHYDLWKGLNS